MADSFSYDYQVEGWQDWNGDVHRGEPDDVSEVMGMYVHYWDESGADPTDHYSWEYIDPPPFEDWDDWDDLIFGVLSDHGYSMV